MNNDARATQGIPCKHQIFLDDFASNCAAIDARCGIIGWRVRCGHCYEAIAGAVKESDQILTVQWTHDDSSWFGKFEEVPP